MCIQSVICLHQWKQVATDLLEAVAALNVTGVAVTGGRKDGEGEESSDGGETSEHVE